MSSYDDVVLEFGDDDDADNFLTGKLAALGIDEDLELSGGEEESEDPGAAAASPAASPKPSSAPAAETVSPPPPPKSNCTATEDWGQSPAAAEDWEEAPQPVSSTVKPTETSAAGGSGEEGEIEDGELLELLEKPLQASRGRTQQHGSRDSNRGSRVGGSRGGGGARKGGGSRGKAHGRARSNNGTAYGRNVTIKECAKWMCDRLDEPKYYLMCRVVATIGYRRTRDLLERVQKTQDAGGMPTADGSRKRTAGGVFFTLLKEHMEPAKLKELYADEIRVKKEKDRAQRSANKRKAEAALAGHDVMTPRDPPRQRRRDSSSSGGGGGFTRSARDMGTWAGPGAS